jgi:ribonuclease HII
VRKHQFILGIDEAGRGPLAGPVAVGGVWMKKEEYLKLKRKKAFKGLHNSKALSEKQREEWYEKILEWKKEGILNFSYSTGSVKDIDNIGISPTIRKPLNRIVNITKKEPGEIEILLDGSLYAPKKYINQKTIIKGDEKESIISLASIVAKVRRDRWIVKKSGEDKYRKYNLDIHKGYGTKDHRERIKKYGLSNLHRRTFCKYIKYG